MKLAVKIYCDESSEVIDISGDDLRALQKGVDGYVECVTLNDDLRLWFNEDGKSLGLDFNAHATAIFHTVYGYVDIILGNVVITGTPNAEGHLKSLTDKQVEEISEWVAQARFNSELESLARGEQ